MMVRLLPHARHPILSCESAVRHLNDVMDIVAASHVHSADKLLLNAAWLPDEFFALQSGFAGEFVQKLVNHRITVAAVFGDQNDYSKRFREYLSEARHSHQFRAFDDEPAALSWLEMQP
jgi:Domain of unknown function (DUF4180)